MSASITITEPDSLPCGGTHHGVDAYVALMQRIGEIFDLKFAPDGLHSLKWRQLA